MGKRSREKRQSENIGRRRQMIQLDGVTRRSAPSETDDYFATRQPLRATKVSGIGLLGAYQEDSDDSEPRSPFSGSAVQQQQAKPAEVKPKDKMEDELAGFLAEINSIGEEPAPSTNKEKKTAVAEVYDPQNFDPHTQSHLLPEPWQAVYDEASGYHYFWNCNTNEVQWFPPQVSPMQGPSLPEPPPPPSVPSIDTPSEPVVKNDPVTHTASTEALPTSSLENKEEELRKKELSSKLAGLSKKERIKLLLQKNNISTSDVSSSSPSPKKEDSSETTSLKEKDVGVKAVRSQDSEDSDRSSKSKGRSKVKPPKEVKEKKRGISSLVAGYDSDFSDSSDTQEDEKQMEVHASKSENLPNYTDTVIKTNFPEEKLAEFEQSLLVGNVSKDGDDDRKKRDVFGPMPKEVVIAGGPFGKEDVIEIETNVFGPTLPREEFNDKKTAVYGPMPKGGVIEQKTDVFGPVRETYDIKNEHFEPLPKKDDAAEISSHSLPKDDTIDPKTDVYKALALSIVNSGIFEDSTTASVSEDNKDDVSNRNILDTAEVELLQGKTLKIELDTPTEKIENTKDIEVGEIEDVAVSDVEFKTQGVADHIKGGALDVDDNVKESAKNEDASVGDGKETVEDASPIVSQEVNDNDAVKSESNDIEGDSKKSLEPTGDVKSKVEGTSEIDGKQFSVDIFADESENEDEKELKVKDEEVESGELEKEKEALPKAASKNKDSKEIDTAQGKSGVENIDIERKEGKLKEDRRSSPRKESKSKEKDKSKEKKRDKERRSKDKRKREHRDKESGRRSKDDRKERPSKKKDKDKVKKAEPPLSKEEKLRREEKLRKELEAEAELEERRRIKYEQLKKEELLKEKEKKEQERKKMEELEKQNAKKKEEVENEMHDFAEMLLEGALETDVDTPAEENEKEATEDMEISDNEAETVIEDSRPPLPPMPPPDERMPYPKEQLHDERVEPGYSTNYDDEETRERIADVSHLIFDKLAFLEVARKGLTTFQVMLIEIETRMNDWRQGALDSDYLLCRLEEVDAQICKYEETAAPKGWSCQWSSEHGMYYYYNDRTGESTWTYPDPDTTVIEAKPIMGPAQKQPGSTTVLQPNTAQLENYGYGRADLMMWRSDLVESRSKEVSKNDGPAIAKGEEGTRTTAHDPYRDPYRLAEGPAERSRAFSPGKGVADGMSPARVSADPPAPPPPGEEDREAIASPWDDGHRSGTSSPLPAAMMASALPPTLLPVQSPMPVSNASVAAESDASSTTVAQASVRLAALAELSNDHPLTTAPALQAQPATTTILPSATAMPSATGLQVKPEKKKKVKRKSLASSGLPSKKLKNVSSLVQKWQQVKQKVEEEMQEDLSDDEPPEVVAQKRIEEWRRSQLQSGKSAHNPNFEEIKGDWRERLKKKS